jgi:hypothetical protein
MACSLIVIIIIFSNAHATSIVVKLEKNKIILAGDTRLGRLDVGSSGNVFHDDGCKILPLGTSAIGISGNLDYKRIDPYDRLPDWDAISDAEAAYAQYNKNLQAMADEWARRAVLHYNAFYKLVPKRVRELANVNSDRVLLDAFFVGWLGPNTPVIIWEKIYLSETLHPAVHSNSQILYYRSLPYTTNSITQQLIEGDRATFTANKWKPESMKIPEDERGWRWLEFLIKATHDYDESVGPHVNVLEIHFDRQAKWLQNLTCKVGKGQ